MWHCYYQSSVKIQSARLVGGAVYENSIQHAANDTARERSKGGRWRSRAVTAGWIVLRLSSSTFAFRTLSSCLCSAQLLKQQ